VEKSVVGCLLALERKDYESFAPVQRHFSEW
jgi:hypothetical protein